MWQHAARLLVGAACMLLWSRLCCQKARCRNRGMLRSCVCFGEQECKKERVRFRDADRAGERVRMSCLSAARSRHSLNPAATSATLPPCLHLDRRRPPLLTNSFVWSGQEVCWFFRFAFTIMTRRRVWHIAAVSRPLFLVFFLCATKQRHDSGIVA